MDWRSRDSAHALGAAVLTTLAATLLPRSLVPPFLPIGDYASYDVNTPRALTLVEPVVHAPWLGAPSLAEATLVAAVLGALFWTTARRAGAGVAASAIVLVAFVSRPDLRALLAAAAPGLAAVACLWGCLASPSSARLRVSPGVWTIGVAAAAVALWPPAVVVLPVVLAAALPGRPAVWTTAAAAALVGLLAGLARWAALAAAIGGEAVSLGDVWAVVTHTDPRGTQPFVWAPIAAARLPVALMIAGGASLLPSMPYRRVAAGAIVTLALVGVVPATWRDEAARALYWTGWPLAAVGLSWLGSRASGLGRHAVLAVAAVILVGGGVSASRRQVDAVDQRAFATAFETMLQQVERRLPGAAFIAEDTRLDTALVAARGRNLRRVRPVASLVGQRREAAMPVLAGPAARTALELWGLRFAERFAAEEPTRLPVAELTGRFRCVPLAAPWRELPGLEYTGRLGVHLPAGAGRFEAVVIAAPPIAVGLTSAAGQGRGTSSPLPMELDDLPPVLWPDGGQTPDPAHVATKLELEALATTAFSTVLALGARTPAVAVRFVDDPRTPDVATVCAAPLPRDDGLDGGSGPWRLPVDDPAYFAGGWHAPEGFGPGLFRWSTGRAILLVPSTAARDVTLALDARPAAGGAGPPPAVSAIVNGWNAGSRPLTGAATYEWTIPRTIWIDGTNEIAFELSRTMRPSDTGSHDRRELGMAVTGLRLRRTN
jgi:hypothetical protein